MDNLGKIIKDDFGYGIVLERVYNHDIAKVWNALTDPAKMTHWFTDVEWDFRPGGKITFIFQDGERTKSYGKITAIQPLRLLEFIWHNDDGHPDELARWELFEEGENSTRFIFTYSRIRESLALDVSTGWHVVLNDFGDFLNGTNNFLSFGVGEFSDEDKALKERYEVQFNKLKKYER